MKSKNITLRLSLDEIAALDAYAKREAIPRTQALRIALARLLAKPATAKEKSATTREPGNPVMREGGEAASELGTKGARKRHGS